MSCEKNVYSEVFGWNVPWMSVRFSWSMMSLNSDISVFCLGSLSVFESGVLQSPIALVNLRLYLCYLFLKLDAVFVADRFSIVMSPWRTVLNQHEVTFTSSHNFDLKSVWADIRTIAPLISQFMYVEYLFPSFHTVEIYLFYGEVGLLESTNAWFLLSDPVSSPPLNCETQTIDIQNHC